MITEKTLKEESTNKNHYDDNYNCYGDTIQNTEISTFSIFFNVPILTMSFTQAANGPESGVASPVHS